MQISVIIVGCVLIVIWIKDNYKTKEHNDCKGCQSTNSMKMKKWPPFIFGLLQGIMPCTPLIMIIGYSISMPILGAIIIAVSFCIANTISPAIFLVFISGFLSKKMYEEIPKYIKYVKVSCYVMFIVTAMCIF